VARKKKRQNGGQVEDVERKMDQEAVDDLGDVVVFFKLKSFGHFDKVKMNVSAMSHELPHEHEPAT